MGVVSVKAREGHPGRRQGEAGETQERRTLRNMHFSWRSRGPRGISGRGDFKAEDCPETAASGK